MVDTIGESINNGLQICRLPGMPHPCLLTSNNDAKIRLLALPSLDVISQYTVAGAVNYCGWTLAARVQIGRALAALTELPADRNRWDRAVLSEHQLGWTAYGVGGRLGRDQRVQRAGDAVPAHPHRQRCALARNGESARALLASAHLAWLH